MVHGKNPKRNAEGILRQVSGEVRRKNLGQLLQELPQLLLENFLENLPKDSDTEITDIISYKISDEGFEKKKKLPK